MHAANEAIQAAEVLGTTKDRRGLLILIFFTTFVAQLYVFCIVRVIQRAGLIECLHKDAAEGRAARGRTPLRL